LYLVTTKKKMVRRFIKTFVTLIRTTWWTSLPFFSCWSFRSGDLAALINLPAKKLLYYLHSSLYKK
jgi:hypothetical protein